MPWQTGFEKHAFSSVYRRGFHGVESIGRVLSGYARGTAEHGPESFLAAIPMSIAGKLLGKKKVQNAVWKYVNEPAMRADTALGNVLEKMPLVGKKLFRQKEQIPWGKNLHRTVERSSALAPLTKVRNIAVPIIAGVGMEKAVSPFFKKTTLGTGNQDSKGDNMKDSEIRKMASVVHDDCLREKVASTMLQLNRANKEHEKRAQAMKFLYKKAEMGLEALPPTYEDFEEKIASLTRQDLAVLEKALELSAGDVKLGELTGSDPTIADAAATFQSEILGL